VAALLSAGVPQVPVTRTQKLVFVAIAPVVNDASSVPTFFVVSPFAPWYH
jgi:hypothetical protein